jgi:hypothetical protein
MADPQKAMQTQLSNIEKRTGRTLEQLVAMVRKSGLAKHGEIRDYLKKELGLGHGDANTLTHVALNPPAAAGSAPASGPEAFYPGDKAALLPIHHAVMAAIRKFGDFEEAPKKTYVSLRRKKQFAMVGPATKTQVEVGLNMKGVKPTARLAALPPGGMCQYKVRLSQVGEVDKELLGWIRTAYDAAG